LKINTTGPFLDNNQDKLTLVYFGSIGSGAKSEETFFDGVYANFSDDFLFHIVNVDDFPDVANTLKVYDYPKIVFYYKGKEIERLNSPFSPKELLPHVINAIAQMKN